MALLVVVYLAAIVSANLLVTQFGPYAGIIISFFFIALDLTVRDALHDRWSEGHLWPKMLALIASGSILSYLVNSDSSQIAIASFLAFLSAGISDAVVYQALKEHPVVMRMNASNLVSALFDSVVFVVVAFGFPIMIPVVIGEYGAKLMGGFVWSLILTRFHKPSWSFSCEHPS